MAGEPSTPNRAKVGTRFVKDAGVLRLTCRAVPEIVGPLLVFAALLAAAGVAKGIAPQAAAGALRAMGLPGTPLLVRALGAVEVAIGIWVITTGSPPAALALGAAYLGFAAFVGVALARRLPIGSCGCFGKDDTPPTWIHLAYDLSAVAVAVLAAAQPIGSPSRWLPQLGSHAAGYLLITGAVLLFSYILLAELPKTMALIRKEPAPAGGGT